VYVTRPLNHGLGTQLQPMLNAMRNPPYWIVVTGGQNSVPNHGRPDPQVEN